MKFKNLITFLVVAVFGGIVAVFIYSRLSNQEVQYNNSNIQRPVHFATLETDNSNIQSYPDFTHPAEIVLPCVVHVRVVSKQETYSDNPLFEYFFGYREYKSVPKEGYGSGVIMSSDGYIITNNHVIDKSDEISVTLNDKRVFPAKVIGKDPTTDLALIKIDEKDLPFLKYGNSETLKVGEWVLAVGNPYNLTSTVTAGIVSAKARQLGVLANQAMGIEAFIQTDAVVNPGNSGGALVNIRGELIGINTLIISQTGGFSGNSFAVPSSIVQKVVEDLKEYGYVQRAMLGVGIKEITSEFAKQQGIEKIEGIYIGSINEDGAAKAAGIKEGDIIKEVNNIPVNSFSELQVQLSKYRPNDKVDITIERDKKVKQIPVTLRNMEGTTKIVRGEQSNILGAKFEEISDKERQKINIKNGVVVKELSQGKLKSAGVREGFIITKINDKEVSSVNDIQNIFSEIPSRGRVVIDGLYPNGQVFYYVFAK